VIILGVSFLADASACVLRDGEVVAAVAEERLNRVKLWHGVPRLAIAEVLRLAGISLKEVDGIATHGKAPSAPDRRAYEEKAATIAGAELAPEARDRQLEALWRRYDHEAAVMGRRTPGYLAELADLGRPLLVYGHHEAHAASAFFATAWQDCAILTIDGWGEDGSHAVYHGRGSRIERLWHSHTFDSLGYFYGSITRALGFVPQRHEGKVLGLAAHCSDPRSYPLVRSLIDLDPERRRFVGRMDRGLYVPRFENRPLAAQLAAFPREDVAAAAQQVAEELVCAQVAALGPAARRLALAGGVFANVKLNQRIAELPFVDEVNVFPNMGDGGLAVGAAWLAYVERTGARPAPWRTCYLGPAPADAEVARALAAAGLAARRTPDLHAEIAARLAEGKVVARCTGAMEFGPRALGHRSILYPARDPAVNAWLNARLQRSEFMPFAPATLVEAAACLYSGLEACGASAQYMAITVDCTAEMRRRYPAAVHVDGTARPQLVSAVDHPDLHRILQAYRDRTGDTTLINTSFNIHEEPIVCSAADAVRAFVTADLDVLALGDVIVERRQRGTAGTAGSVPA
jgi:carbamoyltransferase